MASVCTEQVTRFSSGDGGAAAGLCVALGRAVLFARRRLVGQGVGGRPGVGVFDRVWRLRASGRRASGRSGGATVHAAGFPSSCLLVESGDSSTLGRPEAGC